ncbi:hypothetical protein BT246_64880 (plasmid) [Bacillus thuringiensis]|uniref:Uncharacterized protein n=1 Tax=Bacillus thuringiensis TaxID=1428 RepID=A0A9W3X3X8_BACTU|nr:hypothetical protein [Bacillus thuringiensis]ANS51780.1 hypothetical protein BT246_64880 [Bacillus thuringiensis]
MKGYLKHEKSLASVLTLAIAAASLPVTTLTADYSDHVTKNGEKDWMESSSYRYTLISVVLISVVADSCYLWMTN